ncbi:hypothetical protein C3F00_018540 [Pseudomonas sp. MWU13-2860]|nr:hypothetical protein C3F00_018540 [Pseudomonas sp. MWU13-2860]
MIQAFRGDSGGIDRQRSGFIGKTNGFGFPGGLTLAGLRRRAILSGLGSSGHPRADGRVISC